MQYIISPERKLIIKWGFLVKELNFEVIMDVSFFPTKIYQGIRLGGLRLPGYSVGLFDLKVNEKDEKINMFASNFKSLVIIKVQREQKIKYYGINPSKPEIFVEQLNKNIKQ